MVSITLSSVLSLLCIGLVASQYANRHASGEALAFRNLNAVTTTEDTVHVTIRTNDNAEVPGTTDDSNKDVRGGDSPVLSAISSYSPDTDVQTSHIVPLTTRNEWTDDNIWTSIAIYTSAFIVLILGGYVLNLYNQWFEEDWTINESESSTSNKGQYKTTNTAGISSNEMLVLFPNGEMHKVFMDNNGTIYSISVDIDIEEMAVGASIDEVDN